MSQEEKGLIVATHNAVCRAVICEAVAYVGADASRAGAAGGIGMENGPVTAAACVAWRVVAVAYEGGTGTP